MESDDDIELRPSSPVQERRLKRLKKAVRVHEYPRPNTPDGSPSPLPGNSSESDASHSDDSNGQDFEGLNLASASSLEPVGDENGPTAERDALESVKEDDLSEAKVLEFDSVSEDLGGIGNSCSTEAKGPEVEDLKTNELERNQHSLDTISEKRKRKKSSGSDRGEEKVRESTSNKKRAEKERLESLKNLRAESQRLLRESRDAAFKPIPRVHKPISSLLDKIRQRKMELLKKSISIIDDNDDEFAREVQVDDGSRCACLGDDIADKVEHSERQEIFTSPAGTTNNLDPSHSGGSGAATNSYISETEGIRCPMVMDSEADNAFRAPINDTQELYSDSSRSDTTCEALNEKPASPSEVIKPPIPSMNLQLDSAPPDDVSSDEEDNEKENIDPHPHRSADSSPPSGDPVKAFVDEEAEEEDNSDNDLMRFQEDEDDDDEDDAEELNNMIASGYEENLIDKERRDQLHQQWLEKQDAAGMDNLLQKLNCGSKLRDTTSIDEEEDEESNETGNESEDEEYVAQPNAARINLEKVRQMIPQMFSDKDDAYVSSDDEETQKRLPKRCLSAKIEEQTPFLSPAEDESCREVFSLIKKMNTVPDTKRKGRTPSFFDTPRIGQNINVLSKSSFLNRASNHSLPSSQKHGPNKARSFIFGRDDSNSRTSISVSEDSLDTIQKESQPPKSASAKYQSNTQNRYHNLNSSSQESGTCLLEILRKSSRHAERRVQNDTVRQTESVFAAFKLAKKPIQTEGRG